MILEHEEAIRLQAAEKYVSHRLPPPQRDAFEAHFFDCPECAEEVRWEQIFMANGRAAVRPPPADPRPTVLPLPVRPGWFERLRLWRPAMELSLAGNLALAAAVVLLAVMPGRQVPIPAQWTGQEYFAPGPAHGDEDVHRLPPAVPVYQVHFPSLGSQSYSYEVLNSNGGRELSGSLSGPPAGASSLRLTVAIASLPPGVHTLVVHGMPAGEIASRSRFQITH